MQFFHPRTPVFSARSTNAADADRAWILALALGIDALYGELPTAVHPVVWLGKAIESGPRRFRGQRGMRARIRGARASIAIVCTTGWLAHRADQWLARRSSRASLALRALVLSPSFAAKSLIDAANYVAKPLENNDIAEARAGLSWLCSRDADALNESDLACATIASLAENSCDSFVAPLLAWSIAGMSAAWVVRAINTLDAMIGYRDDSWEDVGKFAARLDDVVHYVPARITGVLIVIAAALRGYDARNAWTVMQRDRHKTPSPNGGWPMAAMAGALGVRIDKPGVYSLMPEGRDATVDDIRSSQDIARTAMVLTACCALAWHGLRAFSRAEATRDTV